MNLQQLFEDELRRHGLAFRFDPASGRYAVQMREGESMVSLENLRRDVEKDGDPAHVTRFTEAILAASNLDEDAISPNGLYWCLEPNDYVEKAEFRVELSDHVDRALVHLSEDGRLVTWISSGMLDTLRLSKSQAETRAFQNLARALAESTLESEDIDGERLAFLQTTLPFKSSLILAPNIKDVIGAQLGWPLLAVTPDRDFLYLWAASDKTLLNRVGRVVVKQFQTSSYPVSPDVFRISDKGVIAIGRFPA